MKKWVFYTGIAVLLLAVLYWGFMPSDSVGTRVALAASNPAVLPLNDGSPTPDSTPSTRASATAVLAAPTASTKEIEPVTVAAPKLSDRALPSLTRVIEPLKTVQISERTVAVLGTRDVQRGNVTQTVLVLRDEVSGQLDYRQSALRFVLQPGQDYEAFILERGNAQRLFVNPLYGEIAVDAAAIASEYNALSADKRVVKVQFTPLTVQKKLR